MTSMKEDVSMKTDSKQIPAPVSEEERERAAAERRGEAEKETREIIERYRDTFDELAQ